MDVKTGQICAAFTTHQSVDDACALPDPFAQNTVDVPAEIVGADSAYDTKQAHAMIAAHDAQTSVLPREDAMHLKENTSSAGNRLSARRANSKTTEVAIRVGMITRLIALVRRQSISVA